MGSAASSRGLDADRGNFGLMFAVAGRAGMAVAVDALVARSFGEQSVDVTVYATEVEVVGTERTTLGWRGDGCPLTSGHAWRVVGAGRLAAKATRLPLRQPVALPTSEGREEGGRATAFYIHTAEERERLQVAGILLLHGVYLLRDIKHVRKINQAIE